MKLTVISRYQTASVVYEVGQELDVSEQQAQRLLADSPGSFAIVAAPEVPADDHLVAAPAAPPADKMIRGRRNPQP